MVVVVVVVVGVVVGVGVGGGRWGLLATVALVQSKKVLQERFPISSLIEFPV